MKKKEELTTEVCGKCLTYLSNEIEVLKQNLLIANKSLRQARFNSDELKTSIKEIAFDKQKLARDLYRCQQSNRLLAEQNRKEREVFREKTDRMQQEIYDLKKLLLDTRNEFQTTNKELRDNLQHSAQTAIRLSLMFLRMKETKSKIERKQVIYEKLSNDFSFLIKEQSQIIQKLIRTPSNNDNDFNLFTSAVRITELIEENSNLRLKLAESNLLCAKDNRVNQVASSSTEKVEETTTTTPAVESTSQNTTASSFDTSGEEVIFDRSQHLKVPRSRRNSM